MAEKESTPPQSEQERFTTNLNISNVPIATKIKLDNIADLKGITTTAYVKQIIDKEINGDKK